jgi:hypothetical protein
MQALLVHHPHTQASPVAAILVDVMRDGSTLSLDYTVTGGITDLLLPQPAVSTRADELWRHTCLEAFVRPVSGEAYVEINLSPSTRWALYSFTGYRQGVASPAVDAPSIRVQAEPDLLTLSASVDLTGVLPDDETWHLGLAAVMEERSGNKVYWALAHPSGPPDFHREDCFALQLPAAKQR